MRLVGQQKVRREMLAGRDLREQEPQDLIIHRNLWLTIKPRTHKKDPEAARKKKKIQLPEAKFSSIALLLTAGKTEFEV